MSCINCLDHNTTNSENESNTKFKDNCECNNELKCNKCENCSWCIDDLYKGRCIPKEQHTRENCPRNYNDNNNSYIYNPNITNDTHQNDTHQNDTHQNDTHQNDTNQNDTHQNDTHQNDTHQNDTHQNDTRQNGSNTQNNADSDYRLDTNTPHLSIPNLPNNKQWRNPEYTLKDTRIEINDTDNFFSSISNTTIYIIITIVILLIIVCIILIIMSNRKIKCFSKNINIANINSKINAKKKLILNNPAFKKLMNIK